MAQIELNAEALAITRRKFEVPHGILWPAIGFSWGFMRITETTAAPFGATLHTSVAAFIVKKRLTILRDFEEQETTGFQRNRVMRTVLGVSSL